MISFKIGDLELMDSENYVLQKPIEGLDMPDLRVTQYDKPGEDGRVISSTLYGGRLVTITGVVQGSTDQQYEDARMALATACALERDSDGFPVLTQFSVTTLAGNEYFFYGQVTNPKWRHEERLYSQFLINIAVPDPRLYRSTDETSGLVYPPSGGGFLAPINPAPIISSPSVGGAASITNNGNITTYPIITLKGQLTNPYILNAAADAIMQLNRVIAVGETVVIDMANKSITSNGTSILTAKEEDAEWWGLLPGVNAIGFSTGSASDSGSVEITWHSAVLGI